MVILSVHFDRFLTSSQDLLHTVFRNGKIVKTYTFDDVRDNAKLKESELEDLLLWERLPSALSPPTPTRENLHPDRREDTFSVQSCSMFLSTDSATLQCLFLTADESSSCYSCYLNHLTVYLTKRAIDHTSLQEWRRLCVRIPQEDFALLDCRTER